MASRIMTLFRQWDELRDRSNEPGLDEDDILRRCNETDEVMRQILTLPAKSAVGAWLAEAVDATREAILDHRPATLDEVATKAAFMTANRSFHGWGDFEPIKLIEALTPALTSPSSVETLIAAHKAAWTALEAACEASDEAFRTAGQDAAEAIQAKASDATAAAIDALIEHTYSSIEELKRGMAYLVEHHHSTGDGNLSEWLNGLVCRMAGVSEEEAA